MGPGDWRSLLMAGIEGLLTESTFRPDSSMEAMKRHARRGDKGALLSVLKIN